MTENGCCFTGHRLVSEDAAALLRARLRDAIATLHGERGVTTFYAGGCSGFDTLAAQAVLEYRSDHPAVKLVVVVPYRDQPRGWSQDEKAEYERILAEASEVVCLEDHYFRTVCRAGTATWWTGAPCASVTRPRPTEARRPR